MLQVFIYVFLWFQVIPKERGDLIARENGVRFLETSAKTNVNIEQAFTEVKMFKPFFTANKG